MQKRIDPSGLGTRTTGLAHSDVVGSMTPAFSIGCTSDDSASRARLLHGTVAHGPAWHQAPTRCGGMWFGHVLTSHTTSSDVLQAIGRQFSAPAVSDLSGPGPLSKFTRPHPAYPVLGADLVGGRTARHLSHLGLGLLPGAFGIYRNFLHRQRGR
jgi:hypothetical protein